MNCCNISQNDSLEYKKMLYFGSNFKITKVCALSMRKDRTFCLAINSWLVDRLSKKNGQEDILECKECPLVQNFNYARVCALRRRKYL